jgi:hypothetical protein
MLPGSCESDKRGSRVCAYAGVGANAGIAKANAGISNQPHLILNFMVPSFYLHPGTGDMARQAPCHVSPEKNKRYFNRLEKFVPRFGPEGRTHPVRESDFLD